MCAHKHAYTHYPQNSSQNRCPIIQHCWGEVAEDGVARSPVWCTRDVTAPGSGLGGLVSERWEFRTLRKEPLRLLPLSVNAEILYSLISAAGIWGSGLPSLQDMTHIYKLLISKEGHHHTLILLGTLVCDRLLCFLGTLVRFSGTLVLFSCTLVHIIQSLFIVVGFYIYVSPCPLFSVTLLPSYFLL